MEVFFMIAFFYGISRFAIDTGRLINFIICNYDEIIDTYNEMKRVRKVRKLNE